MSACSAIALQRVPGDYKSGDDLQCTDSLTYPLIDMTGTVLSGVLAVSLISVDRDEEEAPTAGIVVGAVALAAAISAGYGAYQVNRCRQTRAQAGGNEPAATPAPAQQHAPGFQGGACLEDGSCNEDFKCDAPMQVCVPDDPSEFN